MNILKKEDKSTTPKIEKINSSETDLLKNSNDKLLDLITKEKITKSDLNGKIISDITSNEEEEEEEESNDDDYEDDDEENIKIEKKKIEIKKTTASEVLGQENLESKENLNLFKFNLSFFVKKEFKWIVYHTPIEIQKFFKKLYKFIKNDETSIKLIDISSLEKIKEYNEDQILNSIDIIKNLFNNLSESDYFNNNLLIKEFLNIGSSSFSQNNSGIRLFLFRMLYF